MLSADGSTVVATYDAFGRMMEQTRGSNYTQILYGPGGRKLALMNGQTLQKAFVQLPGGATAIYNSSGLAYYRHSDWLGSSRLAATPTRTKYYDVAYAPYGESYDPSGTADVSFTGQNPDTVSWLDDFMFREYNPVQGRWMSPDPAGFAAVDITRPQTWNRYAYVENNPLSYIDPDGTSGCDLSDPGCWVTGDGIQVATIAGQIAWETLIGPSDAPTIPSQTDQTDAQIRKQNGCIAKALAAGGAAALQNYIPLSVSGVPIPADYQSHSDAGFTVLGATGDFLAAGGKAVVSVGLRKLSFAVVADVLDEVPFLGEGVMLIQAGKAAYDGIGAYAETFKQCMGGG
jgi:RHS repeat-associated protein